MKSLKKNRGITLVALIITIIVLLILAVVTISAVNEGNLFAHANNAATKYKAEAELENSLLSNLISDMENYAKKTDGPGPGPTPPPEPPVNPEVAAIIGEVYMCNNKGCFWGIKFFSDGTAQFNTGGEDPYTGTYEVDTENNTIALALNIDEDTMNVNMPYTTILNASNEIENLLVDFNGSIYIKNPGTAPNIDGIYANTSNSNEQIKFQTETTADGATYVATYYSSNGGTTFGELDAWYCLYNSTNSCYDICYGQDGSVEYTFDGNNTITKIGSPNKTYVRQS